VLRHRFFANLLFSLSVAATLYSKEPPAQVIVWPASGTPVLRFSFGKFKELSSAGKQHNYLIDTTAENVWGKKISDASFTLYLFDKSNTRIGEGWISLSNVEAGQLVKFQTTVGALGTVALLELVPRSLPAELQSLAPPKVISITVNSVPQGALLKVDGNEAGTTPKQVQISTGKHLLEFSRQGFNPGKFPLEIGPDDVSGGSVSFELGTSAHDTIELRDGSVLMGDVELVSATEVIVRIGGAVQHFNRNQVKRIALTERETPQ
jgi:hypothetical protein